MASDQAKPTPITMGENLPYSLPFNELNPVVQCMVMMYLTGHLPRDIEIRDEEFRRAPEIYPEDNVELVIHGHPDVMNATTKLEISVLINGIAIFPISRYDPDMDDVHTQKLTTIHMEQQTGELPAGGVLSD